MTGKTNAQRKILLTTPDAVTPTKSQQIITTPEDYDGLESVTINAIPDNYIDTSDATATASDILSGETAYVDGSLITGTIATKTSSNLTASGKTVTVPAGYYASTATKSVSTATQATPSISVSSAGKITASSTQTAGYVSAGTKSATKQLTTQAAKTWTPSTSSQSIAAGTYLTGKQTIAAIPSSYIQPTATQVAKTWTPTTTDQTIAAGTYCSGKQIIKGEPNLFAENLPRGLTLYGIEGTRRLQHEYWEGVISTTTSSQELRIPVDDLPQDGFPTCIHMRAFGLASGGTVIGRGAVMAVASSWKYSTFCVHTGLTWTYEFDDDSLLTYQSGDYLYIGVPGDSNNYFPAAEYHIYFEFHYMYDGY